MRSIDIQSASLPLCVNEAKAGQVLLTEDGRPVAIVYGLQDLDAEQLDQCRDRSFWELVEYRRQQSALTRDELEQALVIPPA